MRAISLKSQKTFTYPRLSFTNIVLELYTPEDITFQSFSGYAVRGMFYSIIRRVNESYAFELHNSKMLAPFSVSPVLVARGEGFHPCFDRVSKGFLRVNFTIFDGRLNNVLLKFIQEGLGNELMLGKVEVILHSLSFQQIHYDKLYRDSDEIRSFKISFYTPTYFRQTPRDILERYGKKLEEKITISPYRFLPLPDPVLFFKSVARIWRKFSNQDLALQNFVEWLEIGGIAVSGYPTGIRTHVVYEHPTTRKWSVGFTGTVHFSLVKDLYSPERAKIADTLLKFAEYTNVGGGRTAGLGQIKYQVKEGEEPIEQE